MLTQYMVQWNATKKLSNVMIIDEIVKQYIIVQMWWQDTTLIKISLGYLLQTMWGIYTVLVSPLSWKSVCIYKIYNVVHTMYTVFQVQLAS